MRWTGAKAADLGARRLITMSDALSVRYRDRRVSSLLFICLLAAVANSGCGSRSSESLPSRTDVSVPESAEQATLFPRLLAHDTPGLQNVIELGGGLFSGSEPKGAEGFASLARLGVKTVVSVDGARPNLDRARSEGMRYVHIPFGYDGVPVRAGLTLARLVRENSEPIYIHCHHGTHRGPAAAAIAWIASGRADNAQALHVLEMAGTGREYAGLWRDVESYACPAPEAELPELVEIAPVETLAAGMARIDRHWDDLKRCRDAQWQAPREHPDLSAEQEALQLREAYYELGRTLPADRFDGTFRAGLREAEALAGQIESALKEPDHRAAVAALVQLEQCCRRCHEKYRN